MPQGQLFVISAPSGAGKTSLVTATLARVPGLQVSVSHTTRAPRPGEQDGRDYHFVSHTTFQDLIKSDALFEYAEVFGHFYGTAKDTVLAQLNAGHDVILEIDWQGAAQVRALWPEVISIFILPPTRAALRERLISRKQDDAQTIASRMAEADETLAKAPDFDFWVINDTFEVALLELQSILQGERTPSGGMTEKDTVFLQKLLGQP
jgi:guanylate kinase